MAPKAIIRNVCREIISVRYVRCRAIGSGMMCFWLARIISGRSQQVSTRRGADSGSTPRRLLASCQPVWMSDFRYVRFTVAIIIAWTVIAGHSHFFWRAQVSGSSIIVGTRIFNIVVDLDFVSGQSRGSELLLLVGLGRRLLRRLRMLGVILGLLYILLSLAEGVMMIVR